MEFQGDPSRSRETRGGGNSSLREDVKNSVLEAVETISQTVNFEENAEKMKFIIQEHPFLSTFVIISVAVCIIPILTFLMFTFVTLFISLSILLVIEGTIIAFAGFILLFVLGGCLTFSFGISLSLVVTYKLITGLLELLQKSKSSLPKSYLPPGIPISNLSPSSERNEKDVHTEQDSNKGE